MSESENKTPESQPQPESQPASTPVIQVPVPVTEAASQAESTPVPESQPEPTPEAKDEPVPQPESQPEAVSAPAPVEDDKPQESQPQLQSESTQEAKTESQPEPVPVPAPVEDDKPQETQPEPESQPETTPVTVPVEVKKTVIDINHREWVSGAVFGAHYGMLKSLLDKYSADDVSGFQHAAKTAIQTGNTKVFDFIKDNYNIGNLDVVGVSICFGSHLIFAKYFNGDPSEIKNSTILFEHVDDKTFAAKRHNLIKVVIERGTFQDDAFDWMCEYGDYATARKCKVDQAKVTEHLKDAISKGQLDKFKMLRSFPKQPCCEDPCWMKLAAVKAGNIEMVKDIHCVNAANLAECAAAAAGNADMLKEL